MDWLQWGYGNGLLNRCEAAAADGLGDPVVDAALRTTKAHPRTNHRRRESRAPCRSARRPGSRRARATARSRPTERVAALAVELVDKGDDRHVAQPADLEELAGLLLDAPLAPLGAASSTVTALSTAVRVR